MHKQNRINYTSYTLYIIYVIYNLKIDGQKRSETVGNGRHGCLLKGGHLFGHGPIIGGMRDHLIVAIIAAIENAHRCL